MARSDATKIQRRLKLMASSVKRQMPEVLVAALLPTQNATKRKAPYRSGNLRRSYHTEVTSRSPARAAMGTDVEYAPHQEFGTSTHPAKPHLRPAVDETKAGIRRHAERALAIIIKSKAEKVLRG